MSKKRKIIIGILLISFVIIITEVSHALWQINLEQNSTNVITLTCFKIELQDNNPINIQRAYPISDEEGNTLTPYTFTIKNTCETYASYQINLEILNTTTLENLNFLKIMLEDKILFNDLDDTTKTLKNAKSSKKIETGYLDKNQEKTFELRLWLDEKTPANEEFMNKIFESKIIVISSYIKEFDKEAPIASFDVTKTDEELTIDASGSYDEMSNIKNYYYSRDGVNYEKSKNSSYTFKINENIKYGKGTTSLIELEQNTVNEVFVKVEDEYGNQSDVKSMIVGDMLYDKTVDNNLRYVGSTPNNYVFFNNELWRIIGVMNNIEDGNGEKTSRIKIIRDESIGGFAWDNNGINYWVNSSLQKYLNSTYYNSIINKEFMSEVLWNIGANNSYEVPTILRIYELERGNFVYSNRLATWKGIIGLMFPSDYGYATSGGISISRIECLNNSWNNVTECSNNDWLYQSNSTQWTMFTNGVDNLRVYLIYSIGQISTYAANHTHPPKSARPVIYLKEQVKIVSGDGSSTSPYRLEMLGESNE